MTVPLDRLYNFLDNKVNHDMVIYRWIPHGSRKIEDCKFLKDYQVPFMHHNPIMLCHDQEPLKFNDLTERLREWLKKRSSQILHWHLLNRFVYNIHDRYLLLHSEKNSVEVKMFSENYAVPVYYWSHALIARDWFRYAHIDPALQRPCCNYNKDFLIYNRAWNGTREYRLKFMELLVNNKMESFCQTAFSPIDGYDYREHEFLNTKLAITLTDIEKHFAYNHAPSSSSADYVTQDYLNCAVEVVLETLFDDSRLHLTEKVLRPIACGKPFILVSTPQSLDYLRSYGFKTFCPLIDVSYDQETDSLKRLEMIVYELKRISSLKNKSALWQQLNQIAEFNRKRFFSQDFHDQVVAEYETNLLSALQQVRSQANGLHIKDRYFHSLDQKNKQQQYDICLNFLHNHRGIQGS